MRVRLWASEPPTLYQWFRIAWAFDVLFREVRFSANVMVGKDGQTRYFTHSPPDVRVYGAGTGSVELILLVLGTGAVSAVTRAVTRGGDVGIIRLLTVIRDWGADRRRAEALARQEEVMAEALELEVAHRRRMRYLPATYEGIQEMLRQAEGDLEAGGLALHLRAAHTGVTNDLRDAVRLLGAHLDEVEGTDDPEVDEEM